MTAPLKLIGRSSSHFTRVARIFAHELEVPVEFEPVFDLKSQQASTFAGNPALKVPSLRVRDGSTLFGTLNVCRAIAEEAQAEAAIVWPETLRSTLARNAQELLWHGMDAQVLLVLGTGVNGLPADNAFFVKTRVGFENALRWLDDQLDAMLGALPSERRLSLFEVGLFCLLEHVAFRGVFSIPAGTHPNLSRFSTEFAKRASAAATPYRFDAPASAVTT